MESPHIVWGVESTVVGGGGVVPKVVEDSMPLLVRKVLKSELRELRCCWKMEVSSVCISELVRTIIA